MRRATWPGRPHSAGKQTRPRRSRRLEVFRLEAHLVVGNSLDRVSTRIARGGSLQGGRVETCRPQGATRGQICRPPSDHADRAPGLLRPELEWGGVCAAQRRLEGKPQPAREQGCLRPGARLGSGYIGWVRAYHDKYDVAKNTTLSRVLEWWQTIPQNYPGGKTNKQYQSIRKLDPGNALPESPWLLTGYTSESGTLVSANGMTQDLVASDKNAVVLAYSWLDGSATSSTTVKIPFLGYAVNIPQDAYRSEAMTTMNGETLATALAQVLGSDFQGKLQLIGHSHGSKVATVAADALTHLKLNGQPDPLTVNQLTILDSPESDSGDSGYTGAILAEIGVANDNWYFLQDLNISKTPSSTSTFVDNYISALDEPYTEIAYNGSNPNLADVVDANLRDWPDIPDNLSNMHTYAAYWYAGSSEMDTTTKGFKSGRMWSPLLPGNDGPTMPPQNLPYNYYTQSLLWPYYDSQYSLEKVTFSLANNPVFDPVSLTKQAGTPGASEMNDPVHGASVTLKQQKNGLDQFYTGTFKTAREWSAGLTFNYQFTNYQPGDMLNISDFNPFTQKWELAFVMDPTQITAQTDPLKGTISLGSHSIASYDLRFTLSSTAANSISSVTVSNLMQYANPSTLPGNALRSTRAHGAPLAIPLALPIGPRLRSGH